MERYTNHKPKRRQMCTECVHGKHRKCYMPFCTCLCKEPDIQVAIMNNIRLEEDLRNSRSECSLNRYLYGTE